ncbi:hypothetical protein GCM10027034_13830 [Ramlibacter solisilvae]
MIAGRRGAFLLAFSAIVLLTVLGTMLMPRQYVARAQVMVESRAPASPIPSISSPVAAEAELIESVRVAIAALRLLGLQDDEQLKNKWKESIGGEGDFETWAGEQLLKKLDVKPSRESNMLTISYTSRDAGSAARTANAFVQAYVDIARQIREETATRTTGAFSGRTGRFKAALDTAEEKLATYQRENGISVTDEKLDVENLRLSELNTQLVALQSVAANAAGRQRQSQANRAGMDEVLRDPVVSLLSADLARQEARMVELRSRLGDQHPSVIEQRNALEELRGRVDAASRRVTSSIAGESKIAAERVATIQSALEAQRAKVIELKSKREQALRLQRDVELARRAYDSAVMRTNESVLDTGGPRESISIVKPATAPALPSSPRLIVNLIASLVIGTFAGVLAAFWRESRDRRLRLEDDVLQLLDQPLIGVMSNGDRERHRLTYASP